MQFQLHLQIHVLKVIEYIWLTVMKKIKIVFPPEPEPEPELERRLRLQLNFPATGS